MAEKLAIVPDGKQGSGPETTAEKLAIVKGVKHYGKPKLVNGGKIGTSEGNKNGGKNGNSAKRKGPVPRAKSRGWQEQPKKARLEGCKTKHTDSAGDGKLQRNP